MSEKGEEDAPAHSDDLANLVRGLAGVVVEHFGVSQLYDIGSRTPASLASGLCRGPARGGSFGPELAFHLMNCSHHREEATTGGGVGVDVFTQRDQIDLLAVESLGGFEQMHKGARHTAQLGHDQHVARTDVLQELIPTGPIHAGAGHLVGEDLLASRRLQGLDLRIKILSDAADARVPDAM